MKIDLFNRGQFSAIAIFAAAIITLLLLFFTLIPLPTKHQQPRLSHNHSMSGSCIIHPRLSLLPKSMSLSLHGISIPCGIMIIIIVTTIPLIRLRVQNKRGGDDLPTRIQSTHHYDKFIHRHSGHTAECQRHLRSKRPRTGGCIVHLGRL